MSNKESITNNHKQPLSYSKAKRSSRRCADLPKFK